MADYDDPMTREEAWSEDMFAPGWDQDGAPTPRTDAEPGRQPLQRAEKEPADGRNSATPGQGTLLKPPPKIVTSGDPKEDSQPESDPHPPMDLPLGEVIALANQKGGVGKTTSTISLGAALVEEGARVLLIDLDPQGALSVGLGIDPGTLEKTAYDLLLDPDVGLKDALISSKVPGLDLIPSNRDLSAAEIQLVSEVGREQVLRGELAPARSVYNYILIDCPPSLGLLTINALTAADSVLVPLECEYFALRGVALLEETIQKVKHRLNPALEIKGVLATMVDLRTLHGREVLSRVTDHFGDKVFKTLIRKTVRFAEAPVAGEPILTYAPRSSGAQEYRDLAREVINR